MMKNIKKYILFLSILLVMVCGIQYLIDYGYKKKNNDKISLLMKHKVDDEIMIFGSSVAYVHFDPEIIQQSTGLPTYNMGWDGLFFVQYNGLIREYLSYEKRCKYMVIACDFDNLGRNPLITRPDLFYAYLLNPNIYASLYDIEPDKIVKAYYIPGYKLTLLGTTFYNHFIGSNTTEHNGFNPKNAAWSVSDTFKKFNASFEEPLYEKLRTTVNDITRKGIKVVFVIPPVYKDGYSLVANADEIKEHYKALCNNNVFFMDYTRDTLCNTKSFFYNYSHMNAGGATVFSHTFAADLKKLIDSTTSHK